MVHHQDVLLCSLLARCVSTEEADSLEKTGDTKEMEIVTKPRVIIILDSLQQQHCVRNLSDQQKVIQKSVARPATSSRQTPTISILTPEVRVLIVTSAPPSRRQSPTLDLTPLGQNLGCPLDSRVILPVSHLRQYSSLTSLSLRDLTTL